jgi:predicted dehydrogenase
VQLQGTRANGKLEPLEIPSRYHYVPEDMPKGAPYNVGQLYALFARAICSGEVAPSQATFATAVDLHRLIDAIRESSVRGRQIAVS